MKKKAFCLHFFFFCIFFYLKRRNFFYAFKHGSAWLSLVQLGSAWFSLAQLCSAWLSLAQLGLAWLSSAQLGSVRLSLAQLRKAQLGSEHYFLLFFPFWLTTTLSHLMAVYSANEIRTFLSWAPCLKAYHFAGINRLIKGRKLTHQLFLWKKSP